MRQSEKRRVRNRIYRGNAWTSIKHARKAMEENDLEQAREQALLAIQALDKAASKGVIHKNNAARRKSRLLIRLAALESRASKSK